MSRQQMGNQVKTQKYIPGAHDYRFGVTSFTIIGLQSVGR
jgi:hypothetical protein